MSAARRAATIVAMAALSVGCGGAQESSPAAQPSVQRSAPRPAAEGCGSGGETGPADAELGRLAGLVGTWRGDTRGEPGAGTVERTYCFALGGRYLQAFNRSVYPPTAKKPAGETHEDIGFYSHDKARKTLVLRQFHIEGFVSQYTLESADPGAFVFVSEAIENIPSGFRARETLRLIAPGQLEETFELAPPGDDFSLYSRSSLARVELRRD
jgi:hypothetical protein